MKKSSQNRNTVSENVHPVISCCFFKSMTSFYYIKGDKQKHGEGKKVTNLTVK